MESHAGVSELLEVPADRPPPRAGAVAEVVGWTLARLGVNTVFGVIGSGNFVVSNALCAAGARFHATRIEGPAVSAADAYCRVTGRVAVCTVHQGPGLTNTMTALTEAAKARTPVLVLAGDTPAAALTSNFRIDQHDLVTSVGAIAERVHAPATAAADAARALYRAQLERRPVVLMLPIDMQTQPAEMPPEPRLPELPLAPAPAPEAVVRAAGLIRAAQRPVIVAGRGAVLADARDAAEALGARAGALLATSAMANGLFTGLPFALGISGGFASPLAAELIGRADLVLSLGAALNNWTTRHGALIAPDARLVAVDVTPEALGRERRVDLGIVGDAAATAAAIERVLAAGAAPDGAGWRSDELARRIADEGWNDVPYEDAGTDRYIDPRTLSIALDRLLPDERAVAVDSGHFLGYPSMHLRVPDARAWVFANAFQSVGLGLGSAIGAAVARPDRITVAALGDGGTFMALAELETAARLGLRLLAVIYDDAAYGAEVHHFGPMGHDTALVRFPDADLAAIARAAGATAATVRSLDDLEPVSEWVRSGRGPLVLDAKVHPGICAKWLEEAFRGG